MKWSSVVYVIALLFMACLVVGGQCKHIISGLSFLNCISHSFYSCSKALSLKNLYLHVYELIYICMHIWRCHNYIMFAYIYVGRLETRRTYQGGHANATATELSLDESKIHFKFCVLLDCKTKREAMTKGCLCCVTKPEIPCFHSVEECQANCPPIKSK
jgi:hypothetical protein